MNDGSSEVFEIAVDPAGELVTCLSVLLKLGETTSFGLVVAEYISSSSGNSSTNSEHTVGSSLSELEFRWNGQINLVKLTSA